MNQNSKLSIVIPAYNEEENLKKFLPELIDFANKNKFQLIIVNDGSKDNTLALLKENISQPNLTIVNNKVNRGYGGAIKEGIKVAQTEYCITIDADGQHYLDDVEKLFAIIESKDADMVVGSRKGAYSGSTYKKLGKWLIRSFAKLLMPVKIYDINSGMKIYRTDLAQRYMHMYPSSMAFSDVIALVFINNRHLVLEEPIKIKERLSGDSKVNLHSAFQTVMEILNILTLFNPMKIFLPIALLMFVFGIAWTLQFAVRGMGVSVGGSLMIILSMLIFLIGLVAEQLSSIRKQYSENNKNNG